jgi:hypothetical protein
VDPKPGMDDMEKRKFLTLSGLELRPLGRPARSQSLYRLSYPGILNILIQTNNYITRQPHVNLFHYWNIIKFFTGLKCHIVVS